LWACGQDTPEYKRSLWQRRIQKTFPQELLEVNVSNTMMIGGKLKIPILTNGKFHSTDSVLLLLAFYAYLG
jgi:hypothetical protein